MEWASYATTNSASVRPRTSAVSCYVPALQSLFLHGGSDGNEDFNSTHLLNLRTLAWYQGPPSPEPAVGHALCTAPSEALVVFGGWRKDHYSRDTWLWDWKTGLWLPGESEEMNGNFGVPWSRRDHAIVLASDIYIFGGWNAVKWTTGDTAYTEMWKLDAAWKWHLCEVFGESPRPRRGHSLTYDLSTNSLIVYGGIYGYSRYLGDMFALKLSEYVWESIDYSGSAPSPRAYHSASLHLSNLFLFGGLLSGDKVTNELLVFSLDLRTWEKLDLQTAPSPRCGHSCVAIGSSFLIFGGLGAEDERISLETIWVFETDSEHTFEATLGEIRHKTKLEELADMGIVPPAIPQSLQKSRFYRPKARPFDVRSFPKTQSSA